MKFVILGKDGPEGARLRPIHRTAHLERLQNWAKKGKLILAGPLTDQTGSLIVVDTESFEEANTFANEDPYLLHGVFQEVTIHPFHQVFPPETDVTP
ncbi:MAG: YciI family protein [Nitrospirales bacterium]|nr:YciI family protein [Nitrospirales bacterium]